MHPTPEKGQTRVVHEGRVVATLGPGDVYGEMAFLGHGRRRADVVAETPSASWRCSGPVSARCG